MCFFSFYFFKMEFETNIDQKLSDVTRDKEMREYEQENAAREASLPYKLPFSTPSSEKTDNDEDEESIEKLKVTKTRIVKDGLTYVILQMPEIFGYGDSLIAVGLDVFNGDSELESDRIGVIDGVLVDRSAKTAGKFQHICDSKYHFYIYSLDLQSSMKWLFFVAMLLENLNRSLLKR
jgi:hypothetical protein